MTPARLQTLIGIRKSERDRCAQDLAAATRHQARLLAEEQLLRGEHRQAVEAARQSELSDLVDVRSLSAHRAHVTQLLAAIEGMAAEREAAVGRVEAERERTVAADQRLQMLERLLERETERLDALSQRRAQCELEDAWSARQHP